MSYNITPTDQEAQRFQDQIQQVTKQAAIRRIRNYSGQNIMGPELFQQLQIDYLG